MILPNLQRVVIERKEEFEDIRGIAEQLGAPGVLSVVTGLMDRYIRLKSRVQVRL
ncbi:unnamed protein product [Protopolystoma xenopodis]|uniref:Uncharacterized protein n=1 Tax=Protopolystoma xenopodis TaxID=117903 RepID=A0A448X8Q4_9PLAT|nr:unnamed protein product [Protopolystoma xenopodis]